MAHMDPNRVRRGSSPVPMAAWGTLLLLALSCPLTAKARVFLRPSDEASEAAHSIGRDAAIRVLTTRMVVNGRPTLLRVTATPAHPIQAVADRPGQRDSRGEARRFQWPGPYATWAASRADPSLRRFALRLSPFGRTLLFEFKMLDETPREPAGFAVMAWPPFPGSRELSTIALPDRHLAVKVAASEAPPHQLMGHFARLALTDGWKLVWPPAGGVGLNSRFALWARQQDLLIVSVDSAGPQTPNLVTVLFKRTGDAASALFRP